ncbi:hypothetical protein NDU88_005512 [Pleurodeles waltl]|uniref:Uncharacterized protein n=1 Tax=Pleurodeles waltl TaxID=8319 RepID=A0AAV7TB93_PLEWA|nr:hypothetical protein NDU88_005512 [Pleurodeles waltl]
MRMGGGRKGSPLFHLYQCGAAPAGQPPGPLLVSVSSRPPCRLIALHPLTGPSAATPPKHVSVGGSLRALLLQPKSSVFPSLVGDLRTRVHPWFNPRSVRVHHAAPRWQGSSGPSIRLFFLPQGPHTGWIAA